MLPLGYHELARVTPKYKPTRIREHRRLCPVDSAFPHIPLYVTAIASIFSAETALY